MQTFKLLGAGAALFAAGVFAGALMKDGAAMADAAATPPGYMIVMGKGYDREGLRAYSATLPPIYEKYAGKYLGISAEPVLLEGSFGYDSVLISKWPSLQAAEDFWASPEYREAVKLRAGNGEFHVIAFEGLAEPATVAPIARGE
jgi:uncharacterized protein (DUF1330 family)